MSITVKMPQLGESVTDGTIGTWLVKPGQQVSKYDSLVEVITDKVTAEVPSPAAGTVGQILAGEGERLTVGQPICTLEGADDEAQALEPGLPAAAEEAPLPVVSPAVGVVPPPAAPDFGTAASAPPTAVAPAPPEVAATPGGAEPDGFISPAVRTLAAEHGVDLAQVSGTGFQGRITKRDVMMFLEGGERSQPPGALASAPSEGTPGKPPAGPGERVTLSPMRRAIAEHMVRSIQTAPHAWTMVEVDMSGVAAARAAHRAQFRQTTGVELTFMPYAMQATCRALRAVPSMNAFLDGDSIVLQRDINLGLAVSVPDGLIVPVVRGADRYSLAGLAQAAAALIARARAGKARLEDVEGGTFTLNNAGALGTVMSQAIINQPQAGILVMDAVIKRAVVVGDA
ncbi:MAG: 2-oxo acid dehydrogenase subunit E2, partial [Candidatus Dormibacteraeota bacterium]|nr:2-oxo acid dehydrogenase subunit E2 [Candidatus Dormibacteraeota bacterium]